MRWLALFSLLASLLAAAVSWAPAQEGRYQLDIVVRTRTADGAEPLKDVDLVISGPEGHTGPGSVKGYRIKTDAKGRATVRFNLPGTYLIAAEHPDYEPAATTAKLESDKFPASVSWTLRRKGVVAQYKLIVNAHNNTGDPIRGAEVLVTGPDPDITLSPDKLGLTRRTAQIGDSGSTEITLPMRGLYLIRVSHKNFGEGRRTVEFTETGQTKTEDFILRPISSGMQIEVTVIDQDGDPVSDARVQFGSAGSRATTTDARGRASILVTNQEREVPNILNQLIIDARDLRSKTDPIELLVTHKDYEAGTGTVTPIVGGADRMYPVTVKLDRKTGSGIKIHVFVYEKGSKLPLMDARVVMAPPEFRTTKRFSGSTDGDGRAILTAFKTGTYEITISRSGYDTVNDVVSVDRFEKQEFSFDLQPKPGAAGKMRRMLRLKVRAKNTVGKTVAVKNAAVTLSSGQSGSTDAEGNMCLLHTEAPGESLLVTVTPAPGSGYKPKSDSVIVKANGTLFDAEKIQDAQFKELLRQERLKIQKERPADLTASDNLDRIWEGLGNSWGREFTAPIAAEIERAFGPQAVDNCVIMLDKSAATIDGDVIPKKGAVKIGENQRVEVALIYGEDDADDLQVYEKVELFGPGGKLITSNVGNRTLKADQYNRRYFDIVCQEHGTYQVKSTVTGPNGLTWTDKAAFVVEKGSSSNSGKPAVGVFKLTDKIVGKVTGTGKGPYGDWTSTTSENAISLSYATTTEYQSWANFQGSFSSPPPQLRPGDIIELTCTISGGVRGRDAGSTGVDVGWDASGSVDVVERVKVFCGRGSDGKDYPGGAGKLKIKIGSGGQIKIWSWSNGGWLGDSREAPCVYTYIYEAPATGSTTKPVKGKTTMTVGGGG